MEKNITFYYDKKLIYTKIFILFIVSVICSIIAFKLEDIVNTYKLLKFFYIILITIIFGSFFYGFGIYGDVLYNKIIEISSEELTYFYFFLGKFKCEMNFLWSDIINIEKIFSLTSYKICIIYKEYNEIQRKKLKIRNSEIPYDEIYDILIDKWNEYKEQNNKTK